MNNIIINVIILSQILLIGCSAKSVHKEIDIGECKILIPYNLRESTHEGKYRYSFFTDITPENFHVDLRSISIHLRNYTSAEQFIKKMEEKDSPFKLIKKFKNGNYTIIQFHFSGLENDLNYRVYLKKMMMEFLNIPIKDVNNILEYCKKTKDDVSKKSTTKGSGHEN